MASLSLERAVLCQQWAFQLQEAAQAVLSFRWNFRYLLHTVLMTRFILAGGWSVFVRLSYSAQRTVRLGRDRRPGFQAGEFLLSASCEAEGSGGWGEGGASACFPLRCLT